MRSRLKLWQSLASLPDMWVAVLKRVMAVLAVLALLGAAPVMAASTPAGMPDCGALMGHTAAHDAPCDPATSDPGQPACPTSAIGCTAVALPSPLAQASSVPSALRLWDPGPSSMLLGRTLDPNLFPPIRSV